MVGTGAGSATLLLTILSSPKLIWAVPWEMPVGGTALLTRRTWAETRQAVPGLPQASFLIFKSTHKPIQKYQAYPRPLSSFSTIHIDLSRSTRLTPGLFPHSSVHIAYPGLFHHFKQYTHRPIQQYQAYPGLFPHSSVNIGLSRPLSSFNWAYCTLYSVQAYPGLFPHFLFLFTDVLKGQCHENFVLTETLGV